MDWIELRNLIDTYFNSEELETLCFDLDIDYDSLTGRGKTGKIRELIAYCRRHGSVGLLVENLQKSRPQVVWEEYYLEHTRTQESTDLEAKVLRKKQQDLHSLLNIQMSSLNQLMTEKAKYGGIGIPPRLDYAVQDIKVEIEQTETLLREIKIKLIKLGEVG